MEVFATDEIQNINKHIRDTFKGSQHQPPRPPSTPSFTCTVTFKTKSAVYGSTICREHHLRIGLPTLTTYNTSIKVSHRRKKTRRKTVRRTHRKHPSNLSNQTLKSCGAYPRLPYQSWWLPCWFHNSRRLQRLLL